MTPLEILYQDEDLVAINKPSGMLTHRGWANDLVVAMTALRDQLDQWVYPLHRLDRATSGVLLFALSPAAAGHFGALFQERRMHKSYLALVRGVPADEGLIDHAIAKRADGPKADARTRYLRLQSVGRYSLVRCIPETGRPHQVRRHMKHISCPIIGDVRYGKGDHNRWFRTEYGLHRLALHCESLGWHSEAHGDARTISAPIPDDLRGPLEKLGVLQECVLPADDSDASSSRKCADPVDNSSR